MRKSFKIRLGQGERDRFIDEKLAELPNYKQSAFIKDLLYAVFTGTLEGFTGDLTAYAADPDETRIDDALVNISFSSLQDR